MSISIDTEDRCYEAYQALLNGSTVSVSTDSLTHEGISISDLLGIVKDFLKMDGIPHKVFADRRSIKGDYRLRLSRSAS